MRLHIQIAPFDSILQKQSILLRNEILRKPLGLQFSEQELKSEKNQVHFVATLNNEVVGVLILVKLNDDLLKMRQVAVKESLQGEGIGKSMVIYSEIWAKENYFSKIELHARKGATSFYLGLGYNILGNEFIEVGIPHLKMEKTLITHI